MSTYAAALSRHPVPAHAVGEVAGEVLEALRGADPDLCWLSVTPHHVGALDDIVHALDAVLGPRVLVGATGTGVVGGGHEVELGPGLAVFAATLPATTLVPVHLRAVAGPDGAEVAGWPDAADDCDLLLTAVDPYTVPVDAVLDRLGRRRPGLRVLGGLASAANGVNRLVLDGAVLGDGMVGVACAGAPVVPVVSQGCRPVGEALVVTAGSPGRIDALGGRPVPECLHELAATLPEADRTLLRHGLTVGFAVDEGRVGLGRSDFLVREVLGLDRRTGALAVAEGPTVGRTVRFHVRDAAAADQDLRLMLADPEVEARAVLAFTCTGRGRALFGVPDHDASVIADRFGAVPVAGLACAGEIGPVGGRSALHSFTAALACFT